MPGPHDAKILLQVIGHNMGLGDNQFGAEDRRNILEWDMNRQGNGAKIAGHEHHDLMKLFGLVCRQGLPDSPYGPGA